MWGSFHSDPQDQKIKEIKLRKRVKKEFGKMDNLEQSSIPWIETLLETPIHDYRKNAVKLILAPFLINVKKMPNDIAFIILGDWLSNHRTGNLKASILKYLTRMASGKASCRNKLLG